MSLEVGDKVRFIPSAFADEFGNARKTLGVCGEVTGEVIQIHEQHGWYRVRYEIRPGCTGYETFKI